MKDPVWQKHRERCLMALISAAVVAVCVCVGVTMNLVTLYDENFDRMGIRTFTMFTVISNILAGSSMLLCLSYTVDGLRTGNYHLPNWIVDLVFVNVTAVTLTFLVSLFILSPVKGFVLIFTGSRFFLHGLCPLLAIIAFCCFISHHFIPVRTTFFALIPVFIYAVLYYIMVVVIGEENGGWEDFYGFATRLPIWIPAVLILPLTFGIASLLRYSHNRCVLHYRENDATLYRKACGTADLRKMIEEMAHSQKQRTKISDIVIPARVILLMTKYGNSDMSVEEGCRIYLDAYLTWNKDGIRNRFSEE